MSDTAEPQRSGAFGGASVEDLLRALYEYAMTPLPRMTPIDVEKYRAMLPGPVDLSGLPQMPEAWRRYALERGLFPGQRGSAVPPQVQAVPPQFGQGGGLWGWLHPQGTGNTARGFNDIYPRLGR
jgi:hypothetical protein